MKQNMLLSAVLTASLLLAACGGGESSSGGGSGGVQLTTQPPVDGDTVVRLRLDESCGGTYDMYHNFKVAGTGIQDDGFVDVTVHPGNHRFQLMVAGTKNVVDDDVLTGVKGRTSHVFEC